MLSKLTKHLSWLIVAIASCLLLVLTAGLGHHFGEFQLEGPNGQQRTVAFPFSSSSWGQGTYTLRGSFDRSWFAASTYRIIPDDFLISLKINDQQVELSNIGEDQRRDVSQGFAIDLQDYVSKGENTLEFVFEDYGGNIAMNMLSDKTDWRFSAVIFAWLCLGVSVFILAARKKGISKLHTTLYFLVLLGSIIQVWYIFTYNPVDHIWSDPARHWEQGTDLLRIDLMALTDPVGYQLYVAVIAKLTLKIPELVAFYASLLALFGAWIWYKFLRELQSSKTLALCGWAVLGLLPSWTAIYAYFMQETLFLPLLGAALWSTWRCRRKADIRSFSLMIFLWIIAGLTRGIAIPLAALACTWLWLAQEEKVKKAAYSSLILILIMGPLTYRAYDLVGHFAPHGMGHLNVIYAQSGKKEINIKSELGGSSWGHGFGSPSTGERPFAPFSDWHTQRTGKVKIAIDLDEGTRDWKKAIADQNMRFSDYLWITKENIIFLFFASSWPDNNNERTVDLLNTIMRFIWAPLFVAIIVGLGLHFRKFRGQWMFPAILGAWFFVQCLIPISVNEGRYRKPFEGLAVAQIILWIAVVAGQTRQPAPGTPWGEYFQASRAFITRQARL